MESEARMVPPLVVAEDWAGDVMFFRSVADLHAYIEPWFPSTVNCYAYDSEGRRLELSANPPVIRRKLIGPIWTDNAHQSNLHVEVEAVPSHAAQLVDLLREWLRRVDALPTGAESLTLQELLDTAIEHGGYR